MRQLCIYTVCTPTYCSTWCVKVGVATITPFQSRDYTRDLKYQVFNCPR